MEAKFDINKNQQFVGKTFDESALPSLEEYIRIPNLSRSYDAEWNTNGLLEKAAEHIKNWIESLAIKGLKTEIIKDEGFSPIIFTEIEGTIPTTLLFYGHFDKQPPFTGWDEGLGATIPVIKDGKLYGRGGADDGYSTYGTMIAIKSCLEQGLPIPRCVMITEGDEESGSAHMFHYVEKYQKRIGEPEIIFCLDSGTVDYDRFWLTNSLRGNLVGTLRVQTLVESVHSGDSSGVVPSCYRVANILLNRIENFETGQIDKRFHVNVPANRYAENYRLAELKGKSIISAFPFIEGAKPISEDPLECLLNRGWGPTLTVIGQKEFPEAPGAGNVNLSSIELKFSLRLPPTLDSNKAIEDVRELLTKNVPYGAHAELKNVRYANGWNAPTYEPYLQKLVEDSSKIYFNNEWMAIGEGGGIPVMGKFSELFPKGQFIITGVLGPNSNAHGPNEFLHLDFTRKLIMSMAHIIAGVAQHYSEQKK